MPLCGLPTGTGRFSKSPHPPLARGHQMLSHTHNVDLTTNAPALIQQGRLL